MKGKKRMRTWLVMISVIIVICVTLYQPLINYLSKQAANPTGIIGSIMTRIWSVSFRDMNEWSYSLMNLNDEDVILDIGFGSGSGIQHMKEMNRKNTIYGVDISEEAVKTASTLNKEYIDSGEVILTVGDVAYLDFEDEFFNLVIAGQTHIYWDELEKGLSECYRVLKERGTLFIACEIDKIEYHLPEYKNSEDFTNLLYEIGFSEINVKTHNNYIAFICNK